MKKRVVLLFIIMIMIIGLTGCGSSGSKITIVDVDGNSSELTEKELKKKIEGNTSSFNNKYVTGKITFTGTISEIEDESSVLFGTYSCGTYGQPYYNKVASIKFKNNWMILYVYKGVDEVDIDNLSKGDKVEVTTNISQYSGSFLSLASYDGKSCSFGLTPTTITKK